MCLFSKTKKEDKEDKKLTNLGFFRNEKKEYKKGNYSQSSFEEEDLEDDDYYFDED